MSTSVFLNNSSCFEFCTLDTMLSFVGLFLAIFSMLDICHIKVSVIIFSTSSSVLYYFYYIPLYFNVTAASRLSKNQKTYIPTEIYP